MGETEKTQETRREDEKRRKKTREKRRCKKGKLGNVSGCPRHCESNSKKLVTGSVSFLPELFSSEARLRILAPNLVLNTALVHGLRRPDARYVFSMCSMVPAPNSFRPSWWIEVCLAPSAVSLLCLGMIGEEETGEAQVAGHRIEQCMRYVKTTNRARKKAHTGRGLCPLPSTLHPLPFTLYPLPFTLYPLPFTLHNSTVQYSTVQYSTIQHNTKQNSSVLYNKIHWICLASHIALPHITQRTPIHNTFHYTVHSAQCTVKMITLHCMT